MKTIDKKVEKKFDAVKYMRRQRDRMSAKLSKMSKEEIIEYFKQRKKELPVKPSA